jgi:hypothetical protein
MGASQSSTSSNAGETRTQERALSLCEKQLRAIDLNAARTGNRDDKRVRTSKDSNGGRNDGTITLDDFERWLKDYTSVPAHAVLGTILRQVRPCMAWLAQTAADPDPLGTAYPASKTR